MKVKLVKSAEKVYPMNDVKIDKGFYTVYELNVLPVVR